MKRLPQSVEISGHFKGIPAPNGPIHRQLPQMRQTLDTFPQQKKSKANAAHSLWRMHSANG